MKASYEPKTFRYRAGGSSPPSIWKLEVTLEVRDSRLTHHRPPLRVIWDSSLISQQAAYCTSHRPDYVKLERLTSVQCSPVGARIISKIKADKAWDSRPDALCEEQSSSQIDNEWKAESMEKHWLLFDSSTLSSIVRAWMTCKMIST